MLSRFARIALGGALLSLLALAAPAFSAETQSLPAVARPGPGDPSCARPEYPKTLKGGEQGKVVVSYLIGLDGAVLDGKIAHSSGTADLDRAAYVALSKCLYRMPDGATEPRWMIATFIWK